MMEPNVRLTILLMGLVLVVHGGYLAWVGGEDEEATPEDEDDNDDNMFLLETLAGIALVIGMLLPPSFIADRMNW